jgi:hypothetical protein
MLSLFKADDLALSMGSSFFSADPTEPYTPLARVA